MKPSHHAEPIQSAPTHYAPSVPMSVYRELAAELRANKAVIDSLNSRNQQLLDQNQRLKQEIHNVVQATLNLGQFAGVARPATQDDHTQGFPSAIAPDTLAKLVRAQGEARKVIANEPVAAPEQFDPNQYAPEYAELYRQDHHAQAEQIREQQARAQARAAQAEQAREQARREQAKEQARLQAREQAREKARAKAKADKAARAAQARNRVPRPIQTAPAQVKSPDRAPAPRTQQGTQQGTPKAKTGQTVRQPAQRADMVSATGKPLPKLFTEQSGEYRTNALESQDDKEIGGIWLALSIILIIVTAFGAGFLIMKPLLNDR